jgi:hypothetical protein
MPTAMPNQEPHRTPITENMAIYMAYLLRYASMPITADELQKQATKKHFMRLANYLSELPPDMTFQKRQNVMDLFTNSLKGE